MVKIKRVLLSVSEKSGLEQLAKALVRHGAELISTGGTSKAIAAAGLPVRDVSEVTGFPEMMDGRVKTLHPKIHGGLLALREDPEHQRAMAKHGIAPIDMVVVNLYPFARTVAKPGVDLHEAIENIDIGGPSMIRSAAKNFASVAVVVNPARYAELIEELDRHQGALGPETLRRLAVEAFDHTAEYDAGIHRFLQERLGDGPATAFPPVVRFTFERQQDLRYGENPHQRAAFYRQKIAGAPETSVTGAKQLHGKELSFNNIIDLHAALEIVRDFEEPAACVIKHTNPCGAALGSDIADAYRRAFAADPLSAYGGIVGLNRPCTRAAANAMRDVFLECLIAPAFEPDALLLLKEKKNIRLLETGPFVPAAAGSVERMDLKRVTDGLLVQEWDRGRVRPDDLKVVSRRQPSPQELDDLLFAWRLVKHVKSNAILLAKDRATTGVGPGQTNRVGAVEIALRAAADRAKGSVLASDAYFPFRDGVDAAARGGVTAIIQPGGSVKDPEAIAAADEHGLAMVFTGLRHFKH